MTRLSIMIFTLVILMFAGNVLAGDGMDSLRKDDKELIENIKSHLEKNSINEDEAEKLGKELKYEDSFFIVRKKISDAPKGAVNIDIVNLLIEKMRWLADILYDLARKNGVAGRETYYSYIVAAGRNKDFDKAKSSFDEGVAKIAEFIAQEAQAEGIEGGDKEEREIDEQEKEQGKSRGEDEEKEEEERKQETLEEIKHKKYLKSLCIAYIQAAGENNQFNEAERAYDISEFKTPGIYTNFMNVNYKLKGYKYAQEIYRSGLGAGISMDPDFFANYITIAGNAGDYQEAKDVFELVCEMEVAKDSPWDNRMVEKMKYVYSAYITALGALGRLEDAANIFNRAIENEHADYVTYNAYINLLVQRGDVESAVRIILEHGILEEAQDKARNKRDIDYDFHKRSFGVIYASLHYLLNSMSEDQKVAIMVGKTSHYQRENVLKRAATLFVRLADRSVDSRVGKNPGILNFRLVSRYNPDYILNTTFANNSDPGQGESQWNATVTRMDILPRNLNQLILPQDDGSYDFRNFAYDEAYNVAQSLVNGSSRSEIKIIIGKSDRSHDIRRAIEVFVEHSQGRVVLNDNYRNPGAMILRLNDEGGQSNRRGRNESGRTANRNQRVETFRNDNDQGDRRRDYSQRGYHNGGQRTDTTGGGRYQRDRRQVHSQNERGFNGNWRDATDSPTQVYTMNGDAGEDDFRNLHVSESSIDGDWRRGAGLEARRLNGGIRHSGMRGSHP